MLINNKTINPIQDPKYKDYVFTYNPQFQDLDNYYLRQRAQRWVETELTNLGQDDKDWHERMTEAERHFLKETLAFFNFSDGVVNENLCLNFANEVTVPEAKMFYMEQMAMECVHSRTYSKMVKYYITEPKELYRMEHAITEMPIVAEKAKWALRWIASPNFVERLVAFVFVEGMFFSGSFAAIAWLKHVRKLMINSFGYANELIAKDETLHAEFGCYLYQNYITEKLTEEKVQEIMLDAMRIEKQFILESLPVNLIGMNAKEMTTYLESVADGLMVSLGYNPVFGAKSPFPFMDIFSTNLRVNKFENNNPNYEIAESLSSEEFDMQIDDL